MIMVMIDDNENNDNSDHGGDDHDVDDSYSVGDIDGERI